MHDMTRWVAIELVSKRLAEQQWNDRIQIEEGAEGCALMRSNGRPCKPRGIVHKGEQAPWSNEMDHLLHGALRLEIHIQDLQSIRAKALRYVCQARGCISRKTDDLN